MMASCKTSGISASGSEIGSDHLKACENLKVKIRLTSENPRNLISELCNLFYYLGWLSGTGGGLSIRQTGLIYCTPSKILKDLINPEDVFVLNENSDIIETAKNTKLKCSDCLCLFVIPFKLRDAGCCIHGHSINANLISAICYNNENFIGKERQNNNNNVRYKSEFRISNQEMIKGIKRGSSDENHRNDDTLIVPIIDNVLYEHDLASSLCEAIDGYPTTNAVLVRNHGVFVWGKTWQQAKAMAECYDFLFGIKLEAIKCGFSLEG